MILSHAHKFIYIKTFKTGSTSMETALAGICGPEDVITETSTELRVTRPQPAQNYRIEHPAKPKRPLLKRILGRPERFYHPSVGYYEHMPAWRIRAYCGEEVWNSYYKFTFERQPWDRQVSWYLYKTRNIPEAKRPSFTAFNGDRKRAYVENFDLYSIDDEVVADFVGRYETIGEDFARVLDRLGLSGKVSLPRVNVSKHREAAWRDYYDGDDLSKALVAEWYAREIRHFGYTF